MNKQVKSALKIGGYSVGGLFALILFLSSFTILDETERGVVTRLGEIQGVEQPGWVWKAPFIDSIHVADTTIDSFEYQTNVATQDGQSMGVTVTINHRILTDEDGLKTLYRTFGQSFNYEQRILGRLAIDRVKGVIGQYPMEEFMPRRAEIRMKAAAAVEEAAQEYGINIEDVQISDVQPSSQYRQRLEQVAAARARAEAARQQAREAEFTANKQIEEARGRAESQERLADANAYEIRVNSEQNAAAIQREGEAKATALQAQAQVLRNSEGLVALTQAEAMKNWNGEFNPNVAMFGGNSGGAGLLPFLNVSDQIEK